MQTAVLPTTGDKTTSVTTLRPYDEWYALSLERRGSRQACELCCSSAPGALIDIRIAAAAPDVFEVPDTADATWEDAEWR